MHVQDVVRYFACGENHACVMECRMGHYAYTGVMCAMSFGAVGCMGHVHSLTGEMSSIGGNVEGNVYKKRCRGVMCA